VLDCDPDFADTAAFCERYGVAPEDSANAIVVAAMSREQVVLGGGTRSSKIRVSPQVFERLPVAGLALA
jgi:prolyl-tRNA editing enzyme YbaK/EbsC (Cys-tRNA(Pro) deacylase)